MSVGKENVPQEIWLIKINPTRCDRIPERPDDIVDRRNQLEGNISLFHQLRHLEMLNDMLLGNTFQPEFLAQFDIQAPIRIPRSFSTDADKPYHIPCMEIPADLQATLDFESKLDRSAANIDRLMEAGEESARHFLKERRKVVAGA